MPPPVVMGAQLMCSFGAAPSNLVVVPQGQPVQIEKKFAATIMDHVPMKNILPFGMCMSIANPQVATATTAALGVLTPMPCIPAPQMPWIPMAPTKMVNNKPILLMGSTTMCMWAGVINIVNPGTTTEMVS